MKRLGWLAYIVGEIWDDVTLATKYLESGIDSVFDFSFGQSSGKIVGTVRQAASGTAGKSFANALVQIQDIVKKVKLSSIEHELANTQDWSRCQELIQQKKEILKLNLVLNS